MIIELYINQKFYKQWYREDIREDYSEQGIKTFNGKIKKIINQIKMGVYEKLQYNEWQFFIVIGSYLNLLDYTEEDLRGFEKQVNISRVDKIVNKYKRVVV